MENILYYSVPTTPVSVGTHYRHYNGLCIDVIQPILHRKQIYIIQMCMAWGIVYVYVLYLFIHTYYICDSVIAIGTAEFIILRVMLKRENLSFSEYKTNILDKHTRGYIVSILNYTTSRVAIVGLVTFLYTYILHEHI